VEGQEDIEALLMDLEGMPRGDEEVGRGDS
jgi:hypothetical protein